MGDLRKVPSGCVAFALACALSIGGMPTWALAEGVAAIEADSAIDMGLPEEPVVEDGGLNVSDDSLDQELPIASEDDLVEVASADGGLDEVEAVADTTGEAGSEGGSDDIALAPQTSDSRQVAKASTAKRSIAGATVSVAKSSYRYTGSAIRPTLTVRVGSATLKKGTDYTVGYANNVSAGTATATVTGKGGYSGTKRVTFKITRRSIADASVSSISDRTYTGSAIKPSPTVKVGGRTLKLGTDYKLSYANNTKVGTATITVTGVGNYTSKVTKKFKIVNKPVTISGDGWKTTLPEYWRGKVAKSSRTDATYGKAWEVWPNGRKQYTILNMYATSGSTISSLSRIPSIGTVKLKSGQTAQVKWLQNGWAGFVVRLGNGNTLVAMTPEYYNTWSFNDRGITYSAESVGVAEDLQSLGTMSYSWNDYEDVVLTCLQAIASRTTLN